jgi:hypothetical protein
MERAELTVEINAETESGSTGHCPDSDGQYLPFFLVRSAPQQRCGTCSGTGDTWTNQWTNHRVPTHVAQNIPEPLS